MNLKKLESKSHLNELSSLGFAFSKFMLLTTGQLCVGTKFDTF